MKMKNRSHKYDINRPRSRHGHCEAELKKSVTYVIDKYVYIIYILYIYIYIYIYHICIYIIYIIPYIWHSREKTFTLIYFAQRLLQLNQTFLPVTFHFSTKFTEIFYFSLIETTYTYILKLE